MIEEEKAAVPEWKGDYNYLSRRLERMETDFSERISNLKRKLRLFVRILVDKKIIGEEVSKSIEEVFAEDNEAIDEETLNWLLDSVKDDTNEKK